VDDDIWLTLSPAPVAPSISSMTTRDGLLEPTIDPDSNAGRIRSSIMEPERASLRYQEDVEGSL
jgi:hypothetical protein